MQIIPTERYRAMTDTGIQTFTKFDAIADNGKRENGFMTLHAATFWAGMVNDHNEWVDRRKSMVAAGLI